MKTSKWFARDFIAPDAILSIRDVVEKAGGNEVFLVGRLNNEQVVTDVDVYAMGNKRAVPAIIKEEDMVTLLSIIIRKVSWIPPMRTLRLRHIWDNLG